MHCLSSNQCEVGQCCQNLNSSPHFHTCTSTPSKCQRNPGILDIHDTCSNNQQCATKCCDHFWEECLANNTNCYQESEIGKTVLILIISGVIAFVVILVLVVIIVCVCKKRRRRSRTMPSEQTEDEVQRTDITMRSQDLSVEVYEGTRIARPVKQYEGSVQSGTPCKQEEAHTCSNIIEPFRPQPLKIEQ